MHLTMHHVCMAYVHLLRSKDGLLPKRRYSTCMADTCERCFDANAVVLLKLHYRAAKRFSQANYWGSDLSQHRPMLADCC